MYYLFDTCTTRCSINAHTRPRSHLRIVPIGSDNTSRTKCASSDSEIASNFSLSLSRPGETGKSRRKKRFEAGNAARYTFAPFHAAQCARPSFASHPSARWILLGATDYHARSCSPDPWWMPHVANHANRCVFGAEFFPSKTWPPRVNARKERWKWPRGQTILREFRTIVSLPTITPRLKNVNGKKYYEGKFSFHNSWD